MAEPDLSLAPAIAAAIALEPSPPGWVDAVLADFEAFLRDHASCEKKASGMAMNMASHYPDQPRLLRAMVDLAVEELNHYREVVRIMLERGITPAPDVKDPYINALNQSVRKGPANFLMDRLLIGAIVERRGAERFSLVADALPDAGLKKFYEAIAASEARHWTLFYDLARQHCDPAAVDERLRALTAIEAEVMRAQPLKAALH